MDSEAVVVAEAVIEAQVGDRGAFGKGPFLNIHTY